MTAEMPVDHHGRRKIGRSASVALDIARSFAAVYVVLHHVAQVRGLDGTARFFLSFGQEAVILFFLLSGFVIYANEETRVRRDLRGYVKRQVRRIYPPLIVAIAISILVALFDQRFAAVLDWRSLIGTLLALQDVSSLKPGVIVSPYGGNTPLWSLSYEIIFYALFPFAMTGSWSIQRRTNLIGAICVALFILYALHPNHFLLVGSYFMICLAGAVAAHMYSRGRTRLRDVSAGVAWLYVLSLVAAINVLVSGFAGLGVYPFLMLRHILFAALLVTALYGALGRAIVAHLPERIGWISFVASISYGIYIFHYPIVIVWSFSAGGIGLAVAVLLTIALGYVFDRRLLRFMTLRTSAQSRPGNSMEPTKK